MDGHHLIDRLTDGATLSRDEWVTLLENRSPLLQQHAAKAARAVTDRIFGKQVYFRGIVEYSNICVNDCYYCGIRRANTTAARYRLEQDEILSACAEGYEMGFRTFVLQGGEDPYFTDERMGAVVRAIKETYPDCAVTLSMGERSAESYRALFQAGADRYLLRHETADPTHYARLHPPEMSARKRMACLETLRAIGFQTGCGMMLGSPGQSAQHIAEDMLFLKAFQPHMIGMGPFIPHRATPFASEPAGSVALTLFVLSLTRLMLPHVLLPATTALGTLDTDGRIHGLAAGCNVIMPNLSPKSTRKHYSLYDNKPVDHDALEDFQQLKAGVEQAGYCMVVGRGDALIGKESTHGTQ